MTKWFAVVGMTAKAAAGYQAPSTRAQVRRAKNAKAKTACRARRTGRRRGGRALCYG
ncbi:hypothetical protein [Streptomyces sp. NPDC005784]|uniref:hypothetical protein n=1 Tax=Streptomyces sp. NPDC005784 TaxID=3364731 RepID=UPI0036AEBEE8